MEKRTKTISKTVAPAKLVAPKRVMMTDDQRRERVAERAYERFAARGYEHGHDVEDWLAAEAEV